MQQQNSHSFQTHVNILWDKLCGKREKKSPNKFKTTDIIQNMRSNYNGIKLGISNRKTFGKFPPN